MYPVVEIARGLDVFVYDLFTGAGLAAGAVAFLLLALHRRLPFPKTWLVSLIVVFAAFVGARIMSMAFFESSVEGATSGEAGGLVSFGAIWTAVGVIVPLARFIGLPRADLADAAAPALLLGQGVQRIGCFCGGCCYGPLSNAFLSVRFPKICNTQGSIIGSPCYMHHVDMDYVTVAANRSLAVLPIQLISAMVCFALCALLTHFYLTRRRRGELLGIALLVYGTARFCIQFYRPDYDKLHSYGVWNSGHAFSLVTMCLGLACWRWIREHKAASGPQEE